MNRQNRNISFDFFRDVAILMIVVLHAAMTTPNISEINSFLYELVSRLSTGMQLFFVFSGYFIYESMHKLSVMGVGPSVFLCKRAAKILPLYFTFLLLNIVLFYLFEITFDDFDGFHRNSVSVADINTSNILLHVFMLQGFVPDLMNSLLDGDLSIVTEVYFYVLFPFVIYPFVKTLKQSIVCLLCVLVISMYFQLYIAPYIYA